MRRANRSRCWVTSRLEILKDSSHELHFQVPYVGSPHDANIPDGVVPSGERQVEFLIASRSLFTTGKSKGGQNPLGYLCDQ